MKRRTFLQAVALAPLIPIPHVSVTDCVSFYDADDVLYVAPMCDRGYYLLNLAPHERWPLHGADRFVSDDDMARAWKHGFLITQYMEPIVGVKEHTHNGPEIEWIAIH